MLNEAQILNIAISIANLGHYGQFRNDQKTPYIEHVKGVVALLKNAYWKVIVAAWLHDILEDTKFTIQELIDLGIPYDIIDAVVALTKIKDESEEDYFKRVMKNKIAVQVKIADMKYNLNDKPSEKAKERYIKWIKILEGIKKL